MITISDDLKNELENDSQRVLPKVKAWMSDIRYADNLKTYSSSMTYDKQISSRNPLVHIKFDKTNYDVLTKINPDTVTIGVNQADSQTITSVSTTAETITKSAHGLNNNDVIGFTTTGTLPSPLAINTSYYVVNKTTNTFQVSTSLGGSAVDLTTTGTGTHSFYYRRTRVNCNNHGLDTGTAIWFSTTGTFADITPATDSHETVYYVQNSLTNSFELNTTFANSLSATASTSVAYTGASSGTIGFTAHRYGGNRLNDYGSQKMEIAYMPRYNYSLTFPDYVNANYTLQSDKISNSLVEILEPERIEDTFATDATFRPGTTNLGQFGPNRMYSWRRSNAKDIWTISSGSAVCVSSRNAAGYLLYNTNSSDHYVDFKFSSLIGGSGAVVRYIDDNNYVSAWYSSSGGGTIFIRLMKNGTTYSLGSISTSSWNVNNYYRFQAYYNTFSLYDLGTTQPTSSTSLGSPLISVYRDDDSLKSSDATYAGAGNTSAIKNGAEIDYLAVYGFNYTIGSHVFDGNGYCYSSSALPKANRNQFKNISSNLTNFTFSFLTSKTNAGTGIQEIFWIGDTTGNRAIDCYWNSGKIYVRHTNTAGTTNTLTSVNTYNNDTLYNVQIIKNNSILYLYVNGVLDTSINSAGLASKLKDISTGLTPLLILGAGNGVPDYDIYNGKISEFAVFDYALSSVDIECLNQSIFNYATSNSELSDSFFVPDRAVDMFHEETLTYAFTNFLDNKNNVIQVNGDYYCPEPVVSLETNYGWMSRVQSDLYGSFSSPDFIEIQFDSLKCNRIFVSTGYLSGGISFADCVIKQSDGATLPSTAYSVSSTVQFIDVDGNRFSYQFIELTDTYDIISIRITPTSTCNSYDYARIFTINPIWEVDLSDYVVSFDISKTRDNYDASLPIGATAANSGSVVLDNTERLFSPYWNSTYGKYVFPDTKFFIYTDHEISKTQNFESIAIAEEMYADSWSFDDSSMQVTIAMRDYSKYLQEQNIDGYISRGFSAGKSIADLMMLSGFPRRKIFFEQKYIDAVFRDKPSVFFNLDQSDGLAIVGSPPVFDSYNYMNDEFTSAQIISYNTNADVTGSSLVYSDIISVQDDIKRQIDDLALKTFEPIYHNGSYSFANDAKIYNYSSLPETFSLSSRWTGVAQANYTTEFFHYIPDTSTMVTNTEYTIVSFPNIYKITVTKNSNTNFVYKFKATESSTEYTITSLEVSSLSPHLLTVTNTESLSLDGGTFRLYVDGVEGDTNFAFLSPPTPQAGQYFTFKANSFTTYLSNFAYYNYPLSSTSVYDHYRTSSISIVPNFKYLYVKDSTYWDAMLKIATADLGMFYIDENGNFRYEYRNTLYQNETNRYQVSQIDFSDDVNITTGSFVTEVQTNKVNVKINKSSFDANKTEQIWSAEAMESLVISKITADISPTSNSIPLNNIDNPVWIPSGYVKIDDEIIKYGAINNRQLVNLERGLFGTTAAWHQSQSRAREARYYKVEYSNSPASVVNYPAITQEQFENTVSIDYFISNNYTAEILVSANDPGPAIHTENAIDYYFKRGDGYSNLIILQGDDPLSGDNNIFEISGVPVVTSQSKEVVNQLSSDLASNIRKFRLKEITIDNDFVANKNYAQIIADTIIGYFSNPVKIINISCLGVPQLQLGDLITITNFYALGITNEKFWVIENKLTYDGGIKQDLVLRQYSDPIDNPELKFLTY